MTLPKNIRDALPDQTEGPIGPVIPGTGADDLGKRVLDLATLTPVGVLSLGIDLATGRYAALEFGPDGLLVQVQPVTTSSGAPVGVVVSTAAVLLSPSNVLRRSIVITNNGPGTLYLGTTVAVAAAGATMGVRVPLEYGDSGDGLYTGDLYGIYSEVAIAANVSVWERE